MNITSIFNKYYFYLVENSFFFSFSTCLVDYIFFSLNECQLGWSSQSYYRKESLSLNSFINLSCSTELDHQWGTASINTKISVCVRKHGMLLLPRQLNAVGTKTGLISQPSDEVVIAVTANDQVKFTESIQETLNDMQTALPDEQIVSAEHYTTSDNGVAIIDILSNKTNL